MMKIDKEYQIKVKGDCTGCTSKITLQMFSNRRMFCVPFETYVMKNKRCKACENYIKEKLSCIQCKHFEYNFADGRKCLKNHKIVNNVNGLPTPENNECFCRIKEENKIH